MTAMATAAWKKRPFARSFDLLSSEYGWTDDQILDLTLQRLRQAREVVLERRAEERRQALRDKEIELRTLASYIAAGASEKNMASAKDITLVEPPKDAPRVVRPIPFAAAKGMFGG